MEQEKRDYTFSIIGIGAIIALVLFLLSYHIVLYSDGSAIIAKEHLTFSDTIIDVDEFIDDYNEAGLLERAKKSHLVWELEKRNLVQRGSR